MTTVKYVTSASILIFLLTGMTTAAAVGQVHSSPGSSSTGVDRNEGGSIAQLPAQSAQQEGAAGAVVKNLTLDQAMKTAVEQHPSLRQAKEAIAAAEARVGQSRSGYFPQISASGIAKQGLSGASGALGLRGLVTSPLFRDIGASTAILQNIYDFGRTAHQVKASRWAAISLRNALNAQENLVVLNVQQAYFNALGQRRMVTVDEKTTADRQLIVRQADAFYRAGLKSKVDLMLAQASLAEANLQFVKDRDQLHAAFAELNNAMGIEGEPEYALAEPKILLETPPGADTLAARAQRQRPDLAALDAEVRVNEEILARARSERWPRLIALFSTGWVRFSHLTPAELLLGAFGVDFPILTGGQIKNQIAEAQANVAETRAARESLSQNVRLNVERAYAQVLSALDAIPANEQLVQQTQEALELARERYRVQIGSFLELSSAEAANSAAEAQYARALYRYKIAEAALKYALGQR